MLSKGIQGNKASSFIKNENTGTLIVQNNLITTLTNTVKHIINFTSLIIDLRWYNDNNMQVFKGEIKPDHLDLIF